MTSYMRVLLQAQRQGHDNHIIIKRNHIEAKTRLLSMTKIAEDENRNEKTLELKGTGVSKHFLYINRLEG